MKDEGPNPVEATLLRFFRETKVNFANQFDEFLVYNAISRNFALLTEFLKNFREIA